MSDEEMQGLRRGADTLKATRGGVGATGQRLAEKNLGHLDVAAHAFKHIGCSIGFC
jgi:hypothetical protein